MYFYDTYAFLEITYNLNIYLYIFRDNLTFLFYWCIFRDNVYFLFYLCIFLETTYFN